MLMGFSRPCVSSEGKFFSWKTISFESEKD